MDDAEKIFRELAAGNITEEQAGKALKALSKRDSLETGPWKQNHNNKTIDSSIESTTTNQEKFLSKTIHYFKEELSGTLKLPVSHIDEKAYLETYGVDSVLVLALTSKLEKRFGPLSKTLFFEYQTIYDLAQYFTKAHRDRLKTLLSRDMQKNSIRKPITEKPVTTTPSVRSSRRRRFFIPGETDHHRRSDDIAIIGLSGRFPQANNLEEFWRNLKEGRDCITEIPETRWDYRKYVCTSEEGKMYNKWGGFMDRIDIFDPLFFNISPKDAELMDPQERIFLETAWHTFEDGAYTKDHVWNKHIGVFVGVMYLEYDLFGAEEILKGNMLGPATAYASIANRVSYFFNLKGPSMAVDTMCSSSLTSIHLACESIKSGECEMALAGGVNISIHPHKYVVLSNLRFASTDGRCRSFGQGGDGYVPGEGVGAVLLKPLSRAIEERDHIYAVIKGSAINHGGKSTGYSVPNPAAQGEVISKAMERAKISPRTISYVEAHGTGTPLGDPIEVEGLTRAFREKGQYCPIGSVKSNIGHLESAAGIAGIAKIVLQMKYKQLVPSIHSDKLNGNINFEDSPFYVQKELATWPRPIINEEGQDKEYLRRAAINSFGAGGANAHVILEEFEKAEPEPSKGMELIVLSAMTDRELTTYAKYLAHYLDNSIPVPLSHIAYTLQKGRVEMDKRIAIVVSDVDELKEKLAVYCDNQTNIDSLYYGEVNNTAGQRAARIDVGNKSLEQLASHWTKGEGIDWKSLYKDKDVQTVSLPLYPFGGSRYWLPTTPDDFVSTVRLHPLIEQNTSTLKEQRFITRLTGQEFYLADHVIFGKKTLPGAVYLEMARAAGEIGAEQKALRLENVQWVRPFIITDKPRTIQISLYPEEGGIDFEVTSAEDRSNRIVYSTGRLICGEPVVKNNDTIHVDDIRKRCTTAVDREEYYNRFKSQGFAYGPAFKTIRRLYVNGKEALSKLQIPTQSQSGYMLHPSVIDGAFQTVMGVLDKSDIRNGACLPFAIKTLEIMAPVPEICYAHVINDTNDKGQETGTFTIHITDGAGQLLVRIREFTLKTIKFRPMESSEKCDLKYYQSLLENIRVPKNKKPLTGTTILFDRRDALYKEMKGRTEAPLILVKPGGGFTPLTDRVYTMNRESAEDYDLLINAVNEKNGMPENIIYLWPQQDHFLNVYSLFYLTKALMKHDLKDEVRLLYIYTEETQSIGSVFNAAISGFAKTVSLENPKIFYKTIAIPNRENILEIVVTELNTRGPVEIHYENNRRMVRQIKEISTMSAGGQSGLRQNGLYIITGGTGGLGLLFAKHIMTEVKATVLLTGRSELSMLSEQKANQIKALNHRGRKTGAKVLYMQGDISTKEGSEALIREIKETYGSINGVIHSAGLIRDSFLINKTKEDFDAVIEPKIYGTLNLDYALRDEELDFFILFSSLAGVVGSIGQCDYSYANCFLDYFAFWKEKQKSKTKKILSINWPLWDRGGMDVDHKIREWMKETNGMTPLETERGIEVFHISLRTAVNEIIAIQGIGDRIENTINKLNGLPVKFSSSESDLTEGQDIEQLRGKAETYLKTILSKELKLDHTWIRSDSPMENYGIESVAVMNLTMELEKHFGELPKTLFFEYQTVDALVEYFMENHKPGLTKLPEPTKSQEQTTGRHEGVDSQREVKEQSIEQMEEVPQVRSRFLPPLVHRNEEDIAIIGISGRYPMAKDLDQFWENLKSGRDCITEIPPDRWDYTQYYSPDKGGQGNIYTKWGGFIDDHDKFDALFFNISPAEAAISDPQGRLFLETVWHAIEDSGYTKKVLWGRKIGVFVGIMNSEYQLFGAEEILKGNTFLPGSSYASVANRVSYFFNFTGPSIALDTMCSSSLTAIHLACESMKQGETEMAVAGGVNLLIHPHKYLTLCRERFFSTDGRCRSFGQGGDGYVPGEGVGAVLLKPLSKAIKERDHIYAVIKSTSVNHGGKTTGYYVPNPNAQGALIWEALKNAKIDPRTISCVEAHGTGTSLGDPIEIRGLMKAFKEKGKSSEAEGQYCSIGSVKSNIGHPESAAGIAGLTKVLLQMKYKQLVPSLHSDTLNRNINFKDSPFYVQQSLSTWNPLVINERPQPRRAGVSSFGAGGANGHIILEEYRRPESTYEKNQGEHIIVLSAMSTQPLKQYASKLLKYVGSTNDSIANIAYTLQTGREAMDERMALVASDRNDLKEKLLSYINGEKPVQGLYTGSMKTTQAGSRLLIDSEEGNVFIKMIIENNNLMKLAELWTSGIDIDWNLLYAAHRPDRISLPGYPFARVRHWFPQSRRSEGRYLYTTIDEPPEENTEDHKKQLLIETLDASAAILQTEREQLDADKDLTTYGFDSVRFTELANVLNSKYNIDITPDIFYEYHTINSFLDYLGNEYKDRLSDHYNIKQEELSQVTTTGTALRRPPRTGTLRGNRGVAIIGMSAVMPQSEDVNAFWRNLKAGRDLITEVPEDRWDWREYYGDPMKELNKTKAKYGGFINDIDKFDPLFFGISPKEAEFMDPQQRLFLECVWKTIGDAGYKPSDLSGTETAVFAGVGIPNYAEVVNKRSSVIEAQMSTGNAFSLLANRVSYLLNLHGPSEPVDTACSSSLVAVHRAVEAMENGNCEMAIAGGVNAILTPTLGISFSRAGMLSEDGRCRTFDKEADGYVRGEGVGAVMLKPLDVAIEDRDNIYAVIKGTAENHGGHTASLTAPNPKAQAALLIRAYDKANIDPSTVTYIETHGTGTPLGDPIEIKGLKTAFSHLYKKWGKTINSAPHCAIGSVKTNIGHLETAAGIAGLIKVLLAMKYKTIPPHIHLKELNPYIKLEESPFYIVTKAEDWKQLKDANNNPIPRRAGVSSFGFGGVNAHVVLEEYNKSSDHPETEITGDQLIVLSAKNKDRLIEYTKSIIEFLDTTNESLDNIAYTLQTGREPMEVRIAIIVTSLEEAKERLRAFIEGKDHKITLYQGNVKDMDSSVTEGEVDKRNSRAITRAGELEKTAQLWVAGAKIDWELLYE